MRPRIELSAEVNRKMSRMRGYECIGDSCWVRKGSSRKPLASKAQGDELYIYDAIGADIWGGGVSAIQIAQWLPADKSQRIKVRINSPGGDVFDGIAIYNLLAERPISVQIDSQAASIASVIALAGETVSMVESGEYMIHNPWTVAVGNADEFRIMADILDGVRDNLLGIYVANSNETAESLIEMMDQETYFTAEQAAASGFITDVIPNRSNKLKSADSKTSGKSSARARAILRELDLLELE